VVAGLVPWLLTGWDGDAWLPLQIAGGVVVALGAGVLLHAFARFVIEGRGTPAPVAPTQRLVVGGLYRYVRNPMYLAVLATIVGQALLFGQAVLIVYAAVVAAAFVTFVRWYEEPTLARQFGADYDAYRRAVPGWWPRLLREDEVDVAELVPAVAGGARGEVGALEQLGAGRGLDQLEV
jgi:protein-S-isoprenylcysteine O-methyltransferase Ste14